jgi:Protein O-mannosyl-transferase TMEM260-like
MTDGTSQSDVSIAPAVLPAGSAGNSGTGAFFGPSDWLSFAATGLVLFVVYSCTLAPEVALRFSGILSTSAMYAGVGPPPGVPVWTAYSWLFVRLLPFGSVAWRVAVGSAVAAALACGLLALMVSHGSALLLEMTSDPQRPRAGEQRLLTLVGGLVAGTGLGFSRAVWPIAVVAEVWAVSLLLFTVFLALMFRWAFRPQRRRFLYGGCFALGLLLTSSQEYIVVFPALLCLLLLGDLALGRDFGCVFVAAVMADWVVSAIRGSLPLLGGYEKGNPGLLVAFALVGVASAVAVFKRRRFGSEWKHVLVCCLALLLGVAAYLYLPLTSMTNPPSDWGYPRTAEGFFHLVTRGQYELPHGPSSISSFLGQLWVVAKETSSGLGWPYLLFAVLPPCILRRSGQSGRNWLLGLAALFICVGPLMVAMLAPGADQASVDLIRPYFAPMDVVLALWAGLGVVLVGSLVLRSGGLRLRD